MKILFDHQAFTQQLYGGVSRYICELISGINSHTPHKAHLSLLCSNNIHLVDYKINKLSYPFPHKHGLLQKVNNYYNIIDAEIHSYNIYHATYFDPFLIKHIGNTPYVVTFHDMIYEKLSHKFHELEADKTITLHKKQIIENASHIIAVSESTKRDIVELMNVSPDRISVIHLGSSFSMNNSQEQSESFDFPYILYVGNRGNYKNFLPMLEAVTPILKKYKIKLVCAGGGKFSDEETFIINYLNVGSLVEYKTINDNILPILYNKALAYVFPSLYEGFGIPILEAFSCNCPCIISNTSSLPEVAGDAAKYMDPHNINSMFESIESVILDSKLRNTMIKLGQKRLKQFSWECTVRKTIELYKNLV